MRAAERPNLVSDTCRMAARFGQSRSRQMDLRSSSPFCSTFWWLPVTKSTTDTSRGLAVARPQRADAFERRGQRDHRPSGQRHADIAANGRGVPDLERHQERVDAFRGTAAPLANRSGFEVVQFHDPTGRGDVEAGFRRGQRRPAQTVEIDQRVDGNLRLGEQPGTAGQPRIAITPAIDVGNRRRTSHFGYRGQIHRFSRFRICRLQRSASCPSPHGSSCGNGPCRRR